MAAWALFYVSQGTAMGLNVDLATGFKIAHQCVGGWSTDRLTMHTGTDELGLGLGFRVGVATTRPLVA